jgi:hypothetical protein
MLLSVAIGRQVDDDDEAQLPASSKGEVHLAPARLAATSDMSAVQSSNMLSARHTKVRSYSLPRSALLRLRSLKADYFQVKLAVAEAVT